VAALLAVGVVPACSDDDRDRVPTRRPTLLAVLTDGQLVRTTLPGGTRTVRLSRTRSRPVSGRLLAVTPDGRHVAVLTVPDASPGGVITVLTLPDLRIARRLRLPADSRTTATAAVSPEPDRVVVVGERLTAAGGRIPVGWVVQVPSGDVVARWSIPKPPLRNWTPFDAAVAAASNRLYVSYPGTCDGSGGGCTTGVDVVSWESGELLCRGPRVPATGCIADLHGEVAAIGAGVLGTIAEDQSIVRADADGQIAERWPTDLARNHLMRFAYDEAGERIFALGSCLYTGGLARIDLQAGLRWRRGEGGAGQPGLCGERIAARDGDVAFSAGPEFAGSSGSEITVVDAVSGQVRARLPTDAPVADLVLVG
jgi:hypothetical protein